MGKQTCYCGWWDVHSGSVWRGGRSEGNLREGPAYCPKCGTQFLADPEGVVVITWWPGPELAGTEIACDVLGEQLQAARDLALNRAEDPNEALRDFAREVFDATYCDLGAMPDMPEWSKHGLAKTATA